MLSRVDIEEGVNEHGRVRWLVHCWYDEGDRSLESRDQIGWATRELAERERERLLSAATVRESYRGRPVKA